MFATAQKILKQNVSQKMSVAYIPPSLSASVGFTLQIIKKAREINP